MKINCNKCKRLDVSSNNGNWCKMCDQLNNKSIATSKVSKNKRSLQEIENEIIKCGIETQEMTRNITNYKKEINCILSKIAVLQHKISRKNKFINHLKSDIKLNNHL